MGSPIFCSSTWPGQVVRTHRSYLVNIDKLDEIPTTDSGGYDIRLQNGKSVPLSRSYKEQFRSMFKDQARRSIRFFPRVRILEFGTPRRRRTKIVAHLPQLFLGFNLPAIILIDRYVAALSHVVIMQRIAVYEKKRSAAIYNMDVLGPWLTS